MTQRAFTLIEMFAVVVVVAVLAALLIPTLIRPHRRTARAACTNNLKQVALAFRTWSQDNNDRFPMQASTIEYGGMNFTDSTNLFRNFLVMSNELNNPQVLGCPQDTQRTNASDFGSNFNGANISYFVGLEADKTKPATVLTGDRNITIGTGLVTGILTCTPATTARWTPKEQHLGKGNLAFSDGSVRQLTSMELQRALLGTGLATNRLGMP